MLKLEKELLQSKKKLIEANKKNKEFLARMSHELRTPMNVILANVQMLLQGFFGELQNIQKEKISDIHLHAKELLVLINDILDFSKLSNNSLKLNKSIFNISDFLNNILKQFEILFYSNKVKLISKIEDAIFIDADPIRIKQVINNLISNAIKFTNMGSIEIILEKVNKKNCSIHVKDTGIGIDSQYISKVFKDFFQVPNHKCAGTGLGLSISKSLVEMHGGRITVKSQELKGSEFSIFLPCVFSSFNLFLFFLLVIVSF